MMIPVVARGSSYYCPLACVIAERHPPDEVQSSVYCQSSASQVNGTLADQYGAKGPRSLFAIRGYRWSRQLAEISIG